MSERLLNFPSNTTPLKQEIGAEQRDAELLLSFYTEYITGERFEPLLC